MAADRDIIRRALKRTRLFRLGEGLLMLFTAILFVIVGLIATKIDWVILVLFIALGFFLALSGLREAYQLRKLEQSPVWRLIYEQPKDIVEVVYDNSRIPRLLFSRYSSVRIRAKGRKSYSMDVRPDDAEKVLETLAQRSPRAKIYSRR